MRAVSMHIRITSARHIVNFISYGNYDKKTGLNEINFNLQDNPSSLLEYRRNIPNIDYTVKHTFVKKLL